MESYIVLSFIKTMSVVTNYIPLAEASISQKDSIAPCLPLLHGVCGFPYVGLQLTTRWLCGCQRRFNPSVEKSLCTPTKRIRPQVAGDGVITLLLDVFVTCFTTA